MAKKGTVASKKKKNIKVTTGKLYVQTTVNNTMITLTDLTGNKISGGGTGLVGFKGSKESTPYAAEVLAREIVREARDSYGLKEIGVILRGIGLGRDGVFKAINDLGGVDITYIAEKTPIQFGGCKRHRPRRQ